MTVILRKTCNYLNCDLKQSGFFFVFFNSPPLLFERTTDKLWLLWTGNKVILSQTKENENMCWQWYNLSFHRKKKDFGKFKTTTMRLTKTWKPLKISDDINEWDFFLYCMEKCITIWKICIIGWTNTF